MGNFDSLTTKCSLNLEILQFVRSNVNDLSGPLQTRELDIIEVISLLRHILIYK